MAADVVIDSAFDGGLRTPSDGDFDGFPQDVFTFLRALKNNNNRDWFLDHKEDYERCIKFPGAAFAHAMTLRLRKIFAVEFGSKVFRINRDVRFSKDKSPYNAYFHVAFYPGGRPKNASAEIATPVCFFGLETDKVVLGVGCFEFTKNAIDRYRAAVLNDGLGQELVDIFRSLESKDCFSWCQPHLKRIPAGFDVAHKRADMLRYKGLYCLYEHPPFDGLFGADSLDFFEIKFRELKPIYKWLDKVLKNSS